MGTNAGEPPLDLIQKLAVAFVFFTHPIEAFGLLDSDIDADLVVGKQIELVSADFDDIRPFHMCDLFTAIVN